MFNRFAISVLVAGSLPSFGQTSAIDRYMDTKEMREVAALAPKDRSTTQILSVLPVRQSQRFAEYVSSKSTLVDVALLRQAVEQLRLNKQVGSTSGGSGTTALVSRVAVPGVLGFATEYGSILQANNGNVTTLRGNLLGISRMVFGSEQFPYCPEVDEENCQPASRWLRRFSGAISFGNVRAATTSGEAAAPNSPPVTASLFGNDFRMASWGVRFDITSNDPDDPKYVPAWRGAIKTLRASQESLDFTKAVSELFEQAIAEEVYGKWSEETVKLLKDATLAEFRQLLEQQLDILISRMASADQKFGARIAAVRRGFLNYAAVRDDLLRQIHSHRASLEYTNQHPEYQPYTSSIRFIYSHQPTKSPTLVTANAAFTWYHQVPGALKASRLRDVQLAAQLDRRLGQIPNFGNAVATFGAYYQWMKEDALIVIGPGNVAPGSGIVLPGTAAKLLGTKGHIGVIQGKLTLPINGALKVPISVTWSNRTELIDERDLRGQIGVTLDLDNIFKKQISAPLPIP